MLPRSLAPGVSVCVCPVCFRWFSLMVLDFPVGSGAAAASHSASRRGVICRESVRQRKKTFSFGDDLPLPRPEAQGKTSVGTAEGEFSNSGFFRQPRWSEFGLEISAAILQGFILFLLSASFPFSHILESLFLGFCAFLFLRSLFPHFGGALSVCVPRHGRRYFKELPHLPRETPPSGSAVWVVKNSSSEIIFLPMF